MPLKDAEINETNINEIQINYAAINNTGFNDWDRWISKTPDIQNLRIEQLILPGTHNSGVDQEANYTSTYGTCQDFSPFNQLIRGVRVLDLRVEFHPTAKTQQERFQLVHHIRSGRNIKRDILDQVNRFHQRTGGKELVILDFHTFDKFTPAADAELQTLIKSTLGTHTLIAPYYSPFTLKQIQAIGPMNTVIAYNRGTRDTLFWGGVNQRWKGDFSPSTRELKKFMDAVALETKPEGQLRSIQCAKYNKGIPSPDDFSNKVSEWFASKDIHSYIQKFWIINTDWTTRSYIVGNCRHANVVKAAALRHAKELTPTNSRAVDGIIPGHYRALIFTLSDGHGCQELLLPSNVQDKDTLIIRSTAALNTLIRASNLDLDVEYLTLSKGICLLFIYNGERRRWVLHSILDKPADSTDASIAQPTLTNPTLTYQLSDGAWVKTAFLPTTAPEGAIIHAISYARQSAEIADSQGHRYPIKRNDSLVFTMLNKQWQRLGKRSVELISLSQSSMGDSTFSEGQIRIARPALSQSGVVALDPTVGPTQLSNLPSDKPYTTLNVCVTSPAGSPATIQLRAYRSIGSCRTTPMSEYRHCEEGTSLFFSVQYHHSDNRSLRMGEYTGEFPLQARDNKAPNGMLPIRVVVSIHGRRLPGPDPMAVK